MSRPAPGCDRRRGKLRRVARWGLIALSLCLAAAPLQAQGQFKTNFSFASFDDGLKNFEYTDLPDLADAIVDNTRLTIVPTNAERVVLIADVVDAESGDILYGSVSNPILADNSPLNKLSKGTSSGWRKTSQSHEIPVNQQLAESTQEGSHADQLLGAKGPTRKPERVFRQAYVPFDDYGKVDGSLVPLMGLGFEGAVQATPRLQQWPQFPFPESGRIGRRRLSRSNPGQPGDPGF